MSNQTQGWAWFAGVALLATAAGVWWVSRPVPRLVSMAKGWIDNPAETESLLGELAKPTFREAGDDALRRAEYRDVFLYRDLSKAWQEVYGVPFESWNQGAHGSCVSFAVALGCTVAEAVDWTTGQLPRPPPAVATEPVYGGSRTAGFGQAKNYDGDGSTVSAAVRWITGKTKSGVGGILYRQTYLDGRYDLSAYSIPRSRDWGRNGVPADLTREAAKVRTRSTALVTDWESLCASVESGYPVAIGSQVGYGTVNDRYVRRADGSLPRGLSWGHAMLVVAVRHQKNGAPNDAALFQNSWSPRWVSGPRWPDDQPDGSFWAERVNIEAAIRQRDAWAIGSVSLEGFPYRDIDNRGWVQPAPEPTPARAVVVSGSLALAP